MNFINAWNRFWFSRVDPLPLSMTRVGVGLLWLVWLMVTAPNWQRFYAQDGMLSLSEPDLNSRRSISHFNLIELTEQWIPVASWWWIGLALAITVAVGFKTRIATVGLLLFAMSIIRRNNYIVNGEELVLRMLLLYGCFSPWGERMSLDRWLKKATKENLPSEEILPLVWSWRMMQINFLLIYMISLPYKFAQDIDWFTGDALHWTIASDMWWTRNWMADITLSFNGVIRKLMTWGTVLLEGTFPICVCFRRTRVPSTLAMMSLHFGIAYCIPGVTLFTLSMIVGSAMFLPGEFYKNLAVIVGMDRSSLVLEVLSIRREPYGIR